MVQTDMKRKILYLDVDGVLLGRRSLDSTEVSMAKHSKMFMSYCVEHFNCYWLTSHCRTGEEGALLRYLQQYANANLMDLFWAVNPTTWKDIKTEAIDLKSDFYWVDDSLSVADKEVLEENGLLDRWVEVDTYLDPDGLLKVLARLKVVTGDE